MTNEHLYSLDKMTAEDKAFLIASLSELIASYGMYLSGEFPEFIEDQFQANVAKTEMLLRQSLDDLLVFVPSPLYADYSKG